MPVRLSWIIVATATACAALAGAWTARERVPTHPRLEDGTWLAPPHAIGPLSLIDQRGAPFTDRRLAGAPALLYFGYTHSPEECPAMLAMLARVSRSSVVPHLRVIFVTLDPARDRPDRLARYVSTFDRKFIALTGSAQQVDALAARVGVGFHRIDLPGGAYTIDHGTVLYLLDARGRIVAIFTGPFKADRLEQDLRRAAPWLAADRPEA